MDYPFVLSSDWLHPVIHREAGEAEEAELIVVGIATVFAGCGAGGNSRG